MPSNHLIFCHPFLFLSSFFPSIRVFSKESVLCIRWPKYWSFCFSISPFNEYSALICFKIDWLDLLAVQGTLKSLPPTPQFKRINSSVLSFLYSPTRTSIHDYWKIHSFDYMDLCRQSDVSLLTLFFKNSALSSKILHTINRSFSCCCFHRLSLLISSPLIVP